MKMDELSFYEVIIYFHRVSNKPVNPESLARHNKSKQGQPSVNGINLPFSAECFQSTNYSDVNMLAVNNGSKVW